MGGEPLDGHSRLSSQHPDDHIRDAVLGLWRGGEGRGREGRGGERRLGEGRGGEVRGGEGEERKIQSRALHAHLNCKEAQSTNVVLQFLDELVKFAGILEEVVCLLLNGAL